MKNIANTIVEKKHIVFIFVIIILIASVYSIFHVNVNYDMSQYLPDDSNTKSGMEQMRDEFGNMSNIIVMFDDLTKDQQIERKSELEKIQNVKSVTYLQNDENYQKDNHSKYMITVSVDTYSKEAREVLNTIKEKYGKDAYLSE